MVDYRRDSILRHESETKIVRFGLQAKSIKNYEALDRFVHVSNFGTWVLTAGTLTVAACFILPFIIQLPTLDFVWLFFCGVLIVAIGSGITILANYSNGLLRTCDVCREDIRGRTLPAWKNEHYKTLHSDYSFWLRRVERLSRLTIPLTLAMVIAVAVAFDVGGLYWYVAAIMVLSYVVSRIWFGVWYYRRVRGFRRAWKNSHPPTGHSVSIFPEDQLT